MDRFSYKDNKYKLKFDWLKFGESQTIHQICQTFPLLNISHLRYKPYVHECIRLLLTTFKVAYNDNFSAVISQHKYNVIVLT